jgi:hypothetical protein
LTWAGQSETIFLLYDEETVFADQFVGHDRLGTGSYTEKIHTHVDDVICVGYSITDRHPSA